MSWPVPVRVSNEELRVTPSRPKDGKLKCLRVPMDNDGTYLNAIWSPLAGTRVRLLTILVNYHADLTAGTRYPLLSINSSQGDPNFPTFRIYGGGTAPDIYKYWQLSINGDATHLTPVAAIDYELNAIPDTDLLDAAFNLTFRVLNAAGLVGPADSGVIYLMFEEYPI